MVTSHALFAFTLPGLPVKSNDNPTERWLFGQMIILPGCPLLSLSIGGLAQAGLEDGDEM